jgi:hypothetical protein
MGNPVKHLLGMPFSGRQARLAQKREALNEAEFVRRIADEGGDRDAATVLWTKLLNLRYPDNFTPYPSDSLLKVFGIAEEELDEDLILAILKELNVRPPSKELLSQFGAIDTPLRVAQLIALCRQNPVS